MSTLVKLEDRPSCLPGIKSDIHFPKMKTSFSTSTVRTSLDRSKYYDNNNNHYISRNLCHNIHNNGDIEENQNSSRCQEVDTKSCIPSSVCETSSVLKLPTIGCSNGNRITCLASVICDHEQKPPIDNRWNDQSTLTQPQKCLSQSDSSRPAHSGDDTSTSITDNDSQNNTAHDRNANSLSTNSKDNLGVRFPSIFQHQNGHISNLPRTGPANTNMTHLSQGVTTPSLSSLPRQNMTLVGMKSKLSPRTDTSNTPRSGHGKYALLLPISTSQDYRSRDKGNRKRKSKR